MLREWSGFMLCSMTYESHHVRGSRRSPEEHDVGGLRASETASWLMFRTIASRYGRLLALVGSVVISVSHDDFLFEAAHYRLDFHRPDAFLDPEE
jgi:hypothetical protein